MDKLDAFSFPNYKVLHLIGKGSFGTVFKAVEVDTQNTVALKILLKVVFLLQFVVPYLFIFR